MTEPEKLSINRVIVKRVIGLFAPHRAAVLVMTGTVMVAVVLGLIPPLLLKIIIDDGHKRGGACIAGGKSDET